MAVLSGDDAVRTVAELMDQPASRVEDLLRDTLPDGMAVCPPCSEGESTPWLWDTAEPVQIGGWARPDSYRLVDDDELRGALLRTVPADLGSLGRSQQQEYVRRSVDLAMRGGTTSGVVYPLAVCEIARAFRVRNVGGASAGAIAAAATAAAEVGRSSGKDGTGAGPGAGPGHLRAGFSGLADLVSWLVQVDDPGTTAEPGSRAVREEFRLAQLFRPMRSQHDIFNIAVAVMRRRYWLLPLSFGWAVAWPVKLVVVVLAVLAALGLDVLLGCDTAPSSGCEALGPGAAPVLLLGFVLVVSLAGFGAAGLVARSTAARQIRRRAAWTEPTAQLRALAETATSRPVTGAQGTPATRYPLLLLAPAVIVAAGAWWWFGPTQLLSTAAVGLSLALLCTLVLVLATLGWVQSAGSRHYGLLSGATPSGRRPWLSWLFGAPRPTVDRPLVEWLGDSLAELAGVPGQVLRFGHLWVGPSFEPVPEHETGEQTPAEATVRQLADNPSSRLVNLEMMVTDLTRASAARFPLPVADPVGTWTGGPAALWFDPADLSTSFAREGNRGQDVLPPDVVRAMTSLSESRVERLADGSGEVTLHRLPHPWNLPVVLAVRISMALPVLFTAVRLSHLVPAGVVRDDLGRSVRAVQSETRPTICGEGSAIPTQSRSWMAEPLWWSDGGITSNFPVHLFDGYLPRWPSFGLNLGLHPPGQPTQDVWLPQDWNASVVPSGTLGGGLVSLLMAVVTSARNWRDSQQSSMPGFRSRVAAVRQHPGEGGVSLFMPRATVAGLALRGALAGARLRERFRDDSQWSRHRWLRLRVTAATLQQLRERVVVARPSYDDLLEAGQAGLDELSDALRGDPTRPVPDASYGPDAEFWDGVVDGLDAMSVPSPSTGVVGGVPRPQPVLREVPPT